MKSLITTILLLLISQISYTQTCSNLAGTYTSTGGNVPPNFPGVFNSIPGQQRLFRDGLISACGPLKPCPGNVSGTYTIHTYTMYNNASTPSCVTINLNTGTCGAEVHMLAILGSYFNPFCPSINFLGDVGSSISQPFSFTVPPASYFTVMAQSNNGATLTCEYSFTLSSDTNAITCEPLVVPTLGQWGLIILGLLIISISSIIFVQRRNALAIATSSK